MSILLFLNARIIKTNAVKITLTLNCPPFLAPPPKAKLVPRGPAPPSCTPHPARPSAGTADAMTASRGVAAAVPCVTVFPRSPTFRRGRKGRGATAVGGRRVSIEGRGCARPPRPVTEPELASAATTRAAGGSAGLGGSVWWILECG